MWECNWVGGWVHLGDIIEGAMLIKLWSLVLFLFLFACFVLKLFLLFYWFLVGLVVVLGWGGWRSSWNVGIGSTTSWQQEWGICMGANTTKCTIVYYNHNFVRQMPKISSKVFFTWHPLLLCYIPKYRISIWDLLNLKVLLKRRWLNMVLDLDFMP